MANYLNDYPNPVLSDSTFFRQMKLYVESQHLRGRPYIGEYLDEKNGAWLMGDRERSRYYNHSTFNDLMITGIAGLRPQSDGSLIVNPLIPVGKWKFFCLDNVNYHGHAVTIVWDEDGQRYHQGKGMMLMVDEDGEVAPEIPNRLLLTDVSGEKTFILQLETDGSLSILEET